ncbi:hypothetical protein B566_EDAN012788 [Ephemera danica]|nr:hypothetical protein B566_EDAN012788 [Ephemera danica]
MLGSSPTNNFEDSARQAFSQSIYNRPDSRATGEGTPLDDDSYLGYSVTAGDFTGEGRQGAAVGMPRGASLLGKFFDYENHINPLCTSVVLFTWDLVNVYNVTGAQLGAYFGYSVCSADVDGDGLHDLIVGAPLHTDLSNNEGKYETGRVYVFYQGTENKFRRMETRDGEKSKSRFGLSLTTLGDINKDRYEDFAVGAPYDGPQERGAVYIFHGSKLGVREKHSQVVYAEEVGPTLSTFGFSVAGGHDLDENEYPDLLVGAYESNTIVYFRSRPVVNMNAQLTFSSEVKQINLEETTCRLRDNTPVSCSSLNACFEYSGVGVERRLDFEVQFVLDAKKPKSPRMFFLDKEGRNTMNQTLRLNKGSLVCRNVNVYIKAIFYRFSFTSYLDPGIRDKLTPIEAELRYSMLTSPTSSITSVQRIKRSLEPVLDLNHPPVQRDVINIQKNCGSDNICIPDLNMTAAP